MTAPREPQEGRLPDFLIVGAPRCGTTSLATYLGAHPDVFMSARKELNFFNRIEPTPAAIAHYRGLFADARPDQRAGEATPFYLSDPDAPTRMEKVVPNALLVAILREPVSRAYSHYWWQRLWRAEKRSFADAIAAERAGDIVPGAEYLRCGRYHDQVVEMSRHFPRESTHIVLLDDLRDDPIAVYASICEHIGADPSIRPEVVGARTNTTVRARWWWLWRKMRPRRRQPGTRSALFRFVDSMNSHAFVPEPMDDTLRAELVQYFAEPNAALADWLGRDLSRWSR